MKSGNLNFLEPSGPLQACNGTALPYLEPTLNVKISIFSNDVPVFFLFVFYLRTLSSSVDNWSRIHYREALIIITSKITLKIMLFVTRITFNPITEFSTYSVCFGGAVTRDCMFWKPQTGTQYYLSGWERDRRQNFNPSTVEKGIVIYYYYLNEISDIKIWHTGTRIWILSGRILHSVHLLVLRYIPFLTMRSLATLHALQSLIYTFPSPALSCKWLVNCHHTHIGFPPQFWGNQNVSISRKCHIFMTWKTPGHFASRTEFCRTQQRRQRPRISAPYHRRNYS